MDTSLNHWILGVLTAIENNSTQMEQVGESSLGGIWISVCASLNEGGCTWIIGCPATGSTRNIIVFTAKVAVGASHFLWWFFVLLSITMYSFKGGEKFILMATVGKWIITFTLLAAGAILACCFAAFGGGTTFSAFVVITVVVTVWHDSAIEYWPPLLSVILTRSSAFLQFWQWVVEPLSVRSSILCAGVLTPKLHTYVT